MLSFHGDGQPGLCGSLFGHSTRSGRPGQSQLPPGVPTHSFSLSRTDSAVPVPTFTTTLFCQVVSGLRLAKSTYTHSFELSQCMTLFRKSHSRQFSNICTAFGVHSVLL